MKFLSSTLTLSLKFVFFVTFTVGILMMAILHTYLDRSYYANYFADKLAEIQVKHVERILEEKKEVIPFGIPAEKISEIFKETFTADNLRRVSDTVFDAIENYAGENIFIDLSFVKEKEAEFIDKLVTAAVQSAELRNEAKNYISKNINLGIPANVEIKTTDTVDKVLRAIKFILTEKLIVNLVILAFMFLPLLGIFALNAHPYYKGMKKAGLALAVAGLGASLLQPVSRLLVKSLSSNENLVSSLNELSSSFDPEIINDIFGLAFGKILQIVTVTGLITLGIGVALYAISKIACKA